MSKEQKLMKAINEEDIINIEKLIKAGANVNYINNFAKTPLSVAIEVNSPTIVMILLQHGAQINFEEDYGRDIFFWAIKHHYVDLLEMCLIKGADANSINQSGASALSVAFLYGSSEIILVLLEWNAKINFAEKLGRNIFFWTIECNLEQLLYILLAKGADPNLVNEYGKSALQVAVDKNEPQMVLILLVYGAQINFEEECGREIFFWAVRNNYHEVVKVLLDKGANINSVTTFGETALMLAVERDYHELVPLLLCYKPNINYRNQFGKTALQRAVERGYEDLVLLLLVKGANINEYDKWGKTILQSTFVNNNKKILHLLQKFMCMTDFITKQSNLFVEKEIIRITDIINSRATNLGNESKSFWEKINLSIWFRRDYLCFRNDEVLITSIILLLENYKKSINRKVKQMNFNDSVNKFFFQEFLNKIIFFEEQYSLLHLAVFYQNRKLIGYLKSNGIDVEYADANKVTAWQYGCLLLCDELVFLIKSVNELTETDKTFLNSAINLLSRHKTEYFISEPCASSKQRDNILQGYQISAVTENFGEIVKAIEDSAPTNCQAQIANVLLHR